MGRLTRGQVPEPEVSLLLWVDHRYRELAAAGRLRKIAPRRFNPDGQAWLPVLHCARDGWHFDAMFSNTARAHRLGQTHDWVVIFFERAGHEDQATVVTEHAGPLRGQRVVRGREAACRLVHAQPNSAGRDEDRSWPQLASAS